MTDNWLVQKQVLFDRWAPSYDWLFPSVIYQAIHKRLLTYIHLPDRAQVLDLGCGTGRLLDRLAAAYPTLQGTGLDLSPEMLRQARHQNRHHPRLIFLPGDAAATPFADGQFDAVFNTLSFLHYAEPERVFTEVSRVLQPEGRFYLVDLTAHQAKSRWRISLTGEIQLYSPQAREALGQQAALHCIGHFRLLGPVLLSVFSRSPTSSP